MKEACLEKNISTAPSSENPSLDTLESASETKKLLRKLDWNVLPYLSLLYLLSFLGRSNIGNARLAGLEEDLNMEGLDYNIALAVFFPWYVVAEIPSNIMLKRTSPSTWLSLITVAWGLCLALMGLVKTFTGLIIARMFLGFTEGGLFPGVTWYITLWYKRHESGSRMAMFFSAATLAGAFGGLLARGVQELRGRGGLPGWAWIFTIDGIATCCVGAIAKFLIHDGPETARFLTEAERMEVQRRMKDDASDLDDSYHIRYVIAAFKDWKIYVHMFITLGVYTPLYSISVFLPTIVKGMGYTNETSQLMTVPPYVAGCIATIAAGYATDKARQRGLFMVGFCFITIIGFVMLLSTSVSTVQYAGTFLAVCGIYPNVAVGASWNGNNLAGSTKRAVGIAMQLGFGTLGGVAGGFVYRTNDAPRYFQGHGFLAGITMMSMILCLFMHLFLRKENARRDELMRERGLTLETYREELRAAEREMGDNASVSFLACQLANQCN